MPMVSMSRRSMPPAKRRSTGVDAAALAAGLLAAGHRSAVTVTGADDLAYQLAADARPGDMVVCLGAGDITNWAAGLAAAIEKARGG